MSKKVYVTRIIPEIGLQMLKDKGFEVEVNPDDRILSKEELIGILKAKPYDAVLPLLTDKIDGAVMDACPTAKIFANYAVGFDNINLDDAKSRGVIITNTPGNLVTSVAEHTFALMLAVAKHIPQADKFVRDGKYQGWNGMIFWGQQLDGKVLGLLGAGRIGGKVAQHSIGLGMKTIYYDVKRNEELEKATGAEFRATPEEVLKEADVVSVHVPLLPTTHHLINKNSLALMKPTAILINTSRGPVVDEVALVEALKNKVIWGAGIDVYENEPQLADGLVGLDNVVLTPHTASATPEARNEMATLAAQNIIDFLEGREPANVVKV